MAKVATGKFSARQVEAINEKYLGKEPNFADDIINSDQMLGRALNWYSQMKDSEQAKIYLSTYAKANQPSKVADIEAIAEDRLDRTYGWIARLVNRGIHIPESNKQRLAAYVESLKGPVRTRESANRSERDRLGDFLPDFEDAIDNRTYSFSAYNYLTTRSVPQTYVGRIAVAIARQGMDYLGALEKDDEQLVEAFRSWKKADLVSTVKLCRNMIEDCQRYLGNKIQARKPRKVRQKSVTSKLKLFSAMERFDELQITSIAAESVLGASQLFVYNTSNNVLTIFNAKEGGLDIHRTAIINYDEATTKAKRLGKKARLAIDIVLKGTKKNRSEVLETTVSSEYTKVVDRINTNMILLKAVK